MDRVEQIQYLQFIKFINKMMKIVLPQSVRQNGSLYISTCCMHKQVYNFVYTQQNISKNIFNLLVILDSILLFMTFAQRLLKIQRKSSEGNQSKLVLENQGLKLNLNNNPKLNEFEKHHSDLKSMLQYLECEKSVRLYVTPPKSAQQQNRKISLNKNLKEKSCAKENTGNKIKFQNTPQGGLKLRINKGSLQSEIFQLDRDSALMKNLKNRKTAKENPEDTPTLKKSVMNKSVLKQKRGIPNIGNTCYINAILQCLFHLKDFSEGFVPLCSQKNEILNKYIKLFDSVMQRNNEKPDLSTLPLKRCVSKICSLFIDFHQQDAHQFLRELLDSIHQQINRVTTPGVYKVLEPNIKKQNLVTLSQQYWTYYKKFDDSYIYDSLCGQLCNYVICSNCNFESVGFDNFLDLSIPMIKGKNKLQDLLKEYFEVEVLSDYYFCSSCRKTSKKCLKRSELWRTPNFLIIQLKRSQFGRKNNDRIRIPVRSLNLKQYMNPKQKQVKPAMYYLQGVALHRGVMDGGHYWAHVKDGMNWYSMDDEKVEKLDKQSFVSQYEQQGSGDAYILFYRSM